MRCGQRLFDLSVVLQIKKRHPDLKKLRILDADDKDRALTDENSFAWPFLLSPIGPPHATHATDQNDNRRGREPQTTIYIAYRIQRGGVADGGPSSLLRFQVGNDATCDTGVTLLPMATYLPSLYSLDVTGRVAIVGGSRQLHQPQHCCATQELSLARPGSFTS